MGGFLKTVGTVAGTALGGPAGGMLGGALGGFGSKVASGGDLTDSVGGAMGGAANGLGQGLMGAIMQPHNPVPMGGGVPSANLNAGGNLLTQAPSANGVGGGSAFHDLAFTPSKPTLLDTLNFRAMN